MCVRATICIAGQNKIWPLQLEQTTQDYLKDLHLTIVKVHAVCTCGVLVASDETATHSLVRLVILVVVSSKARVTTGHGCCANNFPMLLKRLSKSLSDSRT